MRLHSRTVAHLANRAAPARPGRWRAGAIALAAGALVLTACSEPPKPDQPVVTMTAAGDIGASDAAAAVLGLADGLDPDAHLALGDLSYGQLAPERAWCDFVQAATRPDFPLALLAGNHDSADADDGRIEEFRACLPNRLPGVVGDYGREYLLDLPAEDPVVRIIAASPNLTFDDGRWNYRSEDEHGRWLADSIAQARQDEVPWVVVAAHVPCLSVGVHRCPDPRDFTEQLLAARVDLVLHGHEHSYGRTHQLALGAQCAELVVDGFEPGCLADTDDRYDAGAGTVFATVGTGGTALRDLPADDPEAGYFAATSGANLQPAHGVLRLVATPRVLQASFEPTVPGSFADTFRIERAR